jgi:hypothetical protein
MNDVAQVFDRQLKHFARRYKSSLDLMRLNARTSVAAKRLQVELDRYELVDQGAKARVICRLARFFCLFWHGSDLRNTAGR